MGWRDRELPFCHVLYRLSHFFSCISEPISVQRVLQLFAELLEGWVVDQLTPVQLDPEGNTPSNAASGKEKMTSKTDKAIQPCKAREVNSFSATTHNPMPGTTMQAGVTDESDRKRVTWHE